MAALVADLQVEAEVGLLGDLHGLEQMAAVLDFAAAGVAIDGVRGVDEVAPVLHQPLDAVIVAALFVGGERQDEVAIGPVILLLEADEIGEQEGDVGLHIGSAAAVEPAVGFAKLKGIEGPVLAPGVDHVEMADEEHGLPRAGSVNARDDVLLARIAAGDLDIAGIEPGGFQPCGDGFGGGSGAVRRNRY